MQTNFITDLIIAFFLIAFIVACASVAAIIRTGV